MNNVIAFPIGNVVEKVDTQVIVNKFVNEILTPWSTANGIDVDSSKFRYTAAGIMACLQGMLLDAS